MAVFLTNTIAAYTPSHSDFNRAVENWDTMSFEQQLSEANKLKVGRGRRHTRSADISNYRVLALDPEFVSGVIASRAVISTENSEPFIYVQTNNRPLLDAFKDQYGGSTHATTAKPSNWIKSVNSAHWVIKSNHARKFYEFVKPYLF